MDQAYTETVVKPGANGQYANRYREEVEKLQKQYEERVNKLRLMARRRAALARDMRSAKDGSSACSLATTTNRLPFPTAGIATARRTAKT